MKVTIDNEANAVYIYFISGKREDKHFPLNTVPVNKDITIDYTKDGKLFGIELLDINLIDLKELEKIEIFKI